MKYKKSDKLENEIPFIFRLALRNIPMPMLTIFFERNEFGGCCTFHIY